MTSIDLLNFGEKLKEIRKKRDYSQNDVFEITGISIETLRRIENGKTLPRFSTLSLLSKCYRTDLVSELRKHFDIIKYDIILDALDSLILSGSEEEINLKKEKVRELNHKLYDFEIKEELVLLFIEGSNQYRSKKIDPRTQIKHLTKSLGEIRNDNFNLEEFKDFIYFPIEIRILILIAANYMDIDGYDTALEIFKFSLEYLLNEDNLGHESKKLVIKIYFNISYCYHLKSIHTKVIEYCDKGISYILNEEIMYFIDYFYFRKGISEYRLNKDYYNSLSRAVILNRILCEHKSQCNIEHILSKQYSITIDI